jgi:hypothetical protein
METLIKIQNELKVPKGNINKFGNYKYRSCEDILEAVKPILLKYSATLILTDEIVAIGAKIFLKATAILRAEKSDATVYGFAELAEHKGISAEQATGTASSYARKYALNGLFLIDETEQDADSKEPAKVEPKTNHAKEYFNLINNAHDAIISPKEKIDFLKNKQGLEYTKWSDSVLIAGIKGIKELIKNREDKLESLEFEKQSQIKTK